MPCAVACVRPAEPPSSRGLPVTHAGMCCFLCIENVSMNHAMICGFVFTSGAGTSMSGPMSMASSEK
jgi:hypothetical protein